MLLLPAGATLAQESSGGWHPASDFTGRFDWIQMTSGEWVKGKIVVMYDAELEFDSEEFDILFLDWTKIRQIRTSQMVTVGLRGYRSIVGKLVLYEDKVTVSGDKTLELHKGEVLTIRAGVPREINFWAAKIFAGVIIRTGNSEVREINLQVEVQRRTIRNRVNITFVGNQNTTDDEKISDNQRAGVSWDKFINERLFLNPIFGEYVRDPFQNIGARYTVGVGAGYRLIDTPKAEWEISGGPAYQETRFDSGIAGRDEREVTPALVVTTDADWDITRWLEFDALYRIQFVDEASGTYNHHMVLSLETEITSLIDFDISWIWDRIRDPREDEDGVVPESDDFRTTVGLTFEF